MRHMTLEEDVKLSENLEIPSVGSIGEIVLIYLLEKEAVHFFDLDMLFPWSFPKREKLGEKIQRLKEHGLIRTTRDRINNGSSPVYTLTEYGNGCARYFRNEEVSRGYPLTRKLLAAYMRSENPEIKDGFKMKQIEDILEHQGDVLLRRLKGARSLEQQE